MMDITQTKSAVMLAVLQTAAHFAATDHHVLILGETGVGKTELARYIHSRSPRANGEMIEVNCGTLSPELALSQLFGHERGSFSGAVQAQRGLFEAADGGTIFLDEVGELNHEAQLKLLTVLQDGQIQRLGNARLRRVNVRVIAATHRDLAAEVAVKRFREDLYYRLRILDLTMPPLRDRREDIPAILAARQGLEGEAVEALAAATYGWPGNVRELVNTGIKASVLGWGRAEVEAAFAPLGASLAEVARGDVAREDVAVGLAARKDGVRAEDIVRVVGCSRNTADALLSRLVRRGVLRRTGRGVYALSYDVICPSEEATPPAVCGALVSDIADKQAIPLKTERSGAADAAATRECHK